MRAPDFLMIGVVLLSSCTVMLGEVSPAPNVLLPRSAHTLALRLTPEVKDAFEVIDEHPSLTMDVTRWRTTLETGFRHGYTQYFAPLPPGAKSDFTLVVLRADPSLVDASGRGAYGGPRANAEVRFQAELIDAHERVLKTWGDTALARRAANSGISEELNATVASAIEAMYEEIANGMPRLDGPAP
jgi:hypothetical protein